MSDILVAARRRLEAGVAPEDLSIALVAPSDDTVIRPRLYEERPGEMRVALHRVLDPIAVRHVAATVEHIESSAAACSPAARSSSASGGSSSPPAAASCGPTGCRAPSASTTSTRSARRARSTSTCASCPHAWRPTGATRRSSSARASSGSSWRTELVGRLRAISEPHGAADDVRVVLVERDRAGPRRARRGAAAEHDRHEPRRRRRAALRRHRDRRADGGSGPPACRPVRSPRASPGRATASVGSSRSAHAGRRRRDRVRRRRHRVDRGRARPPRPPSPPVRPPDGQARRAHAASDLLGLPLVEFAPDPYVTCVDLGAAGAVYTEGLERTVRATGEAANEIKRTINRKLIYPTLDDAKKILQRADYLTESRPPRPAVRPAANPAGRAA